jgi:hypothetical protein
MKQYLVVMSILQNNNYPMREWHFEHMQHKKYAGNLGYVCKSIWFDVGHGVTRDEVIAFFDKIRRDPFYSNIRNSSSIERLNRLERRFISTVPATINTQLYWQ